MMKRLYMMYMFGKMLGTRTGGHLNSGNQCPPTACGSLYEKSPDLYISDATIPSRFPHTDAMLGGEGVYPMLAALKLET